MDLEEAAAAAKLRAPLLPGPASSRLANGLLRGHSHALRDLVDCEEVSRGGEAPAARQSCRGGQEAGSGGWPQRPCPPFGVWLC